MEIVAGYGHAQSAEFHNHVWSLRQVADRRSPGGEHIFAPRCIGTDAKRPATVIEHDLSIGKCARQSGEFADLGMIEPGIETQVLARQLREAAAEAGVSEKTGRWIGR